MSKSYARTPLIKSECRFIRVAVILPLTHSVIHRLPGELIFQFNRHNRDAVDSQHHIDCICIAFRIVPLADTLADILLVVGDWTPRSAQTLA